ncbi:unnamed protein product [Rotaria sp. Silwood2]|nr:unnamed protein product [Rotaria sp. Silwood2]
MILQTAKSSLNYCCYNGKLISLTLAYVTPDQSPRYYPKFVTKEECEAVALRRQQVEAEQTATKDDRTDRPSTSNNS